MLTYMIVVNDAGERKTISQQEFEKRLVDAVDGYSFSAIVEGALNAILDEKAIAAGEYDLSDNDTPMVFTAGDE